MAFNYGGRWDVTQACRRALADGVQPSDLSEQILSRYTAFSFAPDPDLLVRTGGEMRISNYMLWQTAYTELYFTECLWPDFDAVEIDRALAVFAGRDRRFGGVPAAIPVNAGD